MSSRSTQTDVTLGDSASVDAFARLRVSDPVGLFESTLTYDKQPLLWNETIAGTATSTHVADESAVDMVVSASGDSVVRQSRVYTRYQPGKSQLIFATFVIGAGDANVRKRVGYFDENNGIFLEEINGESWVVLRAHTSGAPVDTRITKADWNLDTFPDLDLTKAQIFVIDLEWLGVGRVRVGFVRDGFIHYAHQFLHANLAPTVYMSSAQLPGRLETVATGIPAVANTFKGICFSIISEGGQEEHVGFPFSASNVASVAISGTRVPLLSVQPKTTFNSIVNHVQTIQREINVYNEGSGGAVVEVIYDPVLTGASWTSVDSDSVMEFDISATSLTGGKAVLTFFVAATNQSKSSEAALITGRLPIGLDLAGSNPTALTLAITNLGTVSANGAFNWQEYR